MPVRVTLNRLRDRFLLVLTALGVGAVLLLAGLAVGRPLSSVAIFGVLFFGSIAFIEGQEIRRRRAGLRRWWPLALAWLLFAAAYLLVLGWATLQFGVKWRASSSVIAMLIGFWLWLLLRNRVYKD
jgi:hypothetical protein